MTLVTPEPLVSAWTTYTLELHRIQVRMHEAGVKVLANHAVSTLGDGSGNHRARSSEATPSNA